MKVFMLMLLLLVGFDVSEAENPLVECNVNIKKFRFSGACITQHNEAGVEFLGFYSPDGKLDIILRATGEAVWLSVRVKKVLASLDT